jgi:CHAT domain-containing protein/tetratricopeptide (TPR) repeat protein
VTDARWDLADVKRLASLSQEQRESLDRADFAERLESYQHRLVLLRRLYGEHTPRYAQVLEDLATFLRQKQVNLLAARPVFERCVAIRKQTLGENHPDYVRALRSLVWILLDLGEPETARPLMEKAIALSRTLDGEDTAGYGIILHDLARVFQELGLLKDAVSTYEKALDLVRRHLGESAPETPVLMTSLALALQALRDYADAGRLLEKVVELRREGLNPKTFGPKRIDYAMSLILLAGLRDDQGDPEAADTLVREAVQSLGVTEAAAKSGKVLGLEAVSDAMARRDRARARLRLRALERRLVEVERIRRDGKPNEAVGIVTAEIPKLRKLADGEESDGMIPLLGILVRLHLQCGDFAAAHKAQEDQRTILESLLRAEHWQTVDARLATGHIDRLAALEPPDLHRLYEARSLRDQAARLTSEGHARKGAERFVKVLTSTEGLLGERDPETLERLLDAGIALLVSGDVSRARPFLERALRVARQVQGPRHPTVLICLIHLARARRAIGDAQGARRILAEAATLLDRPSPQRPGVQLRFHANVTIASIEPIGEVTAAARLDESNGPERDIAAVKLLLELQREMLGPESQPVLKSLLWLADRYKVRGRYGAMRLVWADILAIATKVHGPAHWQTLNAQVELAHADHLRGLDREARAQLVQANLRAASADSGRLMRADGDPGSSEFGPLQALSVIQRRVLGDRDPRFIESLEKLGDLLRQQAQYDAAQPILERALALRRQVMGERHPATAQALRNLGNLRLNQGRTAEALALLRAAADSFGEVLGPREPFRPSCLHEVALALEELGRLGEAEATCNEADALFGKSSLDTRGVQLRSLATLGRLQQKQGKYAEAARKYERVMATLKSRAFWDSFQRECTTNYASLLGRTGNLARAKALLESILRGERLASSGGLESLRHMSRGRGGSAPGIGARNPEYAGQLQTLADVLVELGDQPRASQLYEEALILTEELLGTDHPAYIRRLVGQAAGLHGCGKLQEALATIREAEQRVGARGELARRELPALLETKATILMDRNDVDGCVRILEEALALQRNILGEQHPDVARLLDQLAGAHMARGDSAAARESWERALHILAGLGEPDQDRPLRARLVENLARLHLRRGDPEQAIRLCQQALDLREHQLLDNLAGLGDRERLRLVVSLRGPFFQTLELLRGSPERDREMYRHFLVWKGVATSKGRQAIKAIKGGPATDNHNLEAALESDRAHRRDLASDFYARSTDELNQRDGLMMRTLGPRRWDPGRVDGAAERMGRSLEDRGSTESRLFQFVGEGKQPHQPTPEQVAAALPDRAAFVDVLKYPPGATGARYLAFVVRRDGAPVRVELGTAEPIDKAILSWRASLLNGGDFESPGRELYRRIWAALDPLCQAASTIFISPDGELNQLPLGALPDLAPASVPGAYLIERLTFSNIGSARQFVERDAKTPASPSGLLVAGGVDYDRREPSKPVDSRSAMGLVPIQPATAETANPESSLSPKPIGPPLLKVLPLHQTRIEAEAVAALFAQASSNSSPGPVQLLTGPRATKEQLEAAMPGKRFLHLATHGFFAPPELRSAIEFEDGRPRRRSAGALSRLDAARLYPGLLSGLVWAGVNRPGLRQLHSVIDQGTGIMTAEEVAGLDCSGCELAVLSACETGLGPLVEGEGVMGLQRAFHQAGVRNVVASLWSVDDAQTRLLMSRFYALLWEQRRPPLEALRQAQLEILRGTADLTFPQAVGSIIDSTAGALGQPIPSAPLIRGIGAAVASAARENVARARRHPRRWAGWIVSGVP